ncbi:hypothetical protein Aduo_013557 [Ancylostoma duodenale]
MRDAGEERRAHEQPTSAEIPSLYTNVSLKRTTRTPLSDQIRQLKTELSFELGTREVLRQATCDSALNDVCLRHVSCRQLWKLFRSSCGVDQENRCTMSDRETCWQSFEGLSWTGLGNCHCDSANSDCHWIRLHTNYNKCIHDITESGEFPAISSTRTGTALGTSRHAHRTQIKFVDRIPLNRGGSTAAPVTPIPRIRVTTPMPLAPWTRGQLQGVVRVTPAPQSWQVTPSSLHHSNQQRHIAQQMQSQADVHYRPLFGSQVKTTPTYYYYYTTAAPRWDQYSRTSPATFSEQRVAESGAQIGEHRQVVTDQRHASNSRWSLRQTPQPLRIKAKLDSMQQVSRPDAGPTQSTLQGFVQAQYSARSSCQDTVARCEAADECRWHLGELRVRCAPDTCRRAECAAALQRFARFVPFALVESMMFCHCSAGDTPCSQQQEMLYPKCLYSTTSMAMTCTEAARKCDTDHRCRHLRHSLSANCPVSHDECTKTSLDECRRTILHARASILEQPCYCPLSDVECMAHQRTMIPNNPCIEKAMLEYSRLMGYNTPTAAKSASIETNRVYENNVEEAVTKDPSRHHQEKTRTGVDNRGVSKPSGASHAGNRRTHIGQDEHSRKTAETGEEQGTNRYRTKDWKEKEVKSDAKEWNEKSEVAEAEAEQQRGEGWQIGTSSISQTGEQRVVSSTEESGKIADVDGGSSTTTKPEKTMTTWSSHKKTHTEGRRKGKHRTTVSPLDPTEPPPPWVTTTEQLPTTTTTFVTHAPPPPVSEGCNAKDASGRQIFVHTGAVIRRYVDWSGRCSSWCECVAEDQLVCERLPCLEDGQCDAPLTTIDFGERLYLRDRGACFCESGSFICDLPEDMPEVYPGLYLSAGYSTTDIDMLRSEIPADVLERAGFLSSNPATDIASRLQIAFERTLPKGLQCRIVLMPEMSEPGSAFMRVEWFGKNEALNHTKTQWHTGGAEKACSPYAKKLQNHFELNESPRFQLVLSSVKQLKVCTGPLGRTAFVSFKCKILNCSINTIN